MSGLPISQVAERTGIAAGTIRMWEQRYGFPIPERTPAGYRAYSTADVEALQRVAAFRRDGMSVPAALERARSLPINARPTIFGSVPHEGRTRRLRKRTLIALSRAIEDQTMVSASQPLILGAFQRVSHYRAVEHRYARMALNADATVVFANFDAPGAVVGDAPVQVPIESDATIGHEWAVVVDAPGFAACLSAWEPPVPSSPVDDRDRVFEAFWTLDAEVVREASRAGARIARQSAPEVADHIEGLLEGRGMAPQTSSAALEALTARMVGYLESA